MILKKTNLIFLISLVVLPVSMVLAEINNAEKGIRIIQEKDRRDAGFKDISANMTMILKNQSGGMSTRLIKIKILEVKNDGDKILSLFNEPKDVKGTQMLTFSHKYKDDDQWIFLPALKRVKRINSRNKSGPFMGSEFAFEDLGSQEIEKYSYKYLSTETCYNNVLCHVIEKTPTYNNSGYSKQIVWIDSQEYRSIKTEYYDRKGSLLKTLQSKNFKIYNNKFWRPTNMMMINHQTKKTTELKWANYKFNTGLSPRFFNSRSMAK